MRSRYIVAYDIADPARLRRVHRIVRGFGDGLQYSVFQCDLSPAERVLLVEALTAAINHRDDSVLLIDLGPRDGRGRESVESMGRPRGIAKSDRVAVIV